MKLISWKHAVATCTAFPPATHTNTHKAQSSNAELRTSVRSATVGRTAVQMRQCGDLKVAGPNWRLWPSGGLVRLTEQITWRDASLKWQHRTRGIRQTLSKWLLCCFTATCRMGNQGIRAEFWWENLLFKNHMRCWKQMERYFDGFAISGYHSGASTTGKSSDDVMSISSHILQVAAAYKFRAWVVQQEWAPSCSDMASHRGRLESSTLIDVREKRLRLVAHVRLGNCRFGLLRCARKLRFLFLCFFDEVLSTLQVYMSTTTERYVMTDDVARLAQTVSACASGPAVVNRGTASSVDSTDQNKTFFHQISSRHQEYYCFWNEKCQCLNNCL